MAGSWRPMGKAKAASKGAGGLPSSATNWIGSDRLRSLRGNNLRTVVSNVRLHREFHRGRHWVEVRFKKTRPPLTIQNDDKKCFELVAASQ